MVIIIMGPNFLDGYDKLSRFNVCIHGCVDGLVTVSLSSGKYINGAFFSFSRKVLWLNVSPTNYDLLFTF